MVTAEKEDIINEYKAFIGAAAFPCIAAKAALSRQQVNCFVTGSMYCPHFDKAILDFLYQFTDQLRASEDMYHSAAIIFTDLFPEDEAAFDQLLWQRLQSLSDLDAKNYGYDKRVSADPTAADFSFSLKGEAYYIIGLHPNSSRRARSFKYPVLVFNSHAQFEALRETTKYDQMKKVVRKRDTLYSGSVNPMLEDFGTGSEVFQYSGREYPAGWECPLKIHHAGNTDHSAA
ncbi:MAG: hypothetical protein JWQ27_842 [Ferruginibacter sp.]|nr:hypothetical protein [Ferruginibacter sp.]